MSGRCRYALIDGLTPNQYEPQPEVGRISVHQQGDSAAVLRNCGRGFEVVSREAYGSIFDEPFESAHLRGKGGPPVGADVAEGLARDYVRRLITAFGGKSALRRAFGQSRLQDPEKSTLPYRQATGILKSTLVDMDILGPTGEAGSSLP
jgi:hypothetical protein